MKNLLFLILTVLLLSCGTKPGEKEPSDVLVDKTGGHSENATEEEFMLAIVGNDYDLIKQFLENGRDVNKTCLDGLVPIVKAVFEGNIDVMNVLLNYGANPDATFDTRSALSMSVIFNDIDAAKILIEAGADVDSYDGPGLTPLMLAVDEGNEEMVKLLIAAGADASLNDIQKETALDKAFKRGNEKIIFLLEDKISGI